MFTDAPNLSQFFDGYLHQLFGGKNTFFIECICHAYADSRQGQQRIIAFLHGFTVSGFTFYIQMPAGQFGCQSYVLSALANGNREKIVRYDHFHGPVIFIDDDPGYFSGRQCIADKFCGIDMPGDDVDFFSAQLLDDILHPAAFHADAGTNRIDVRIVGCHGKFCPDARFPCSTFDLNNAFTDFRDFGLEQVD